MALKFVLIFAVLIFLFVVELIRREKLTFKYAFSWLTATLIAVIFAAKPKWIFYLSNLIGFEIPSNFVFFSIIGVLVLLSLMMTIFLCQQNRRNDIMAQKIGMLEAEMREMKKGER
ncbi:MAG: DUF2304 domain-containing protein [Candidatus Omnitrophica bacterium]|nr:DUF2304 domain-containing protein [Candidatus Omnitrophota bacterium]